MTGLSGNFLSSKWKDPADREMDICRKFGLSKSWELPEFPFNHEYFPGKVSRDSRKKWL
jgi:hypothetical protein